MNGPNRGEKPLRHVAVVEKFLEVNKPLPCKYILQKEKQEKKVDTESLFRNIFVHGNVTSHFFLFSHIYNRLLSQGRDSPENHPGKGKARTPTTARSEEIEAAEHKNNNISIQIVSLYRNKVKWYSSQLFTKPFIKSRIF